MLTSQRPQARIVCVPWLKPSTRFAHGYELVNMSRALDNYSGECQVSMTSRQGRLMEGQMRGRWSLGVLVAIIVAVVVATGHSAMPRPAVHSGQPVQVTLALQSDGPVLRIGNDAFAISIEF